MTKRRSWAGWFPIVKPKPMGFDSAQHAARNQNSWGAMKNPALMTNEERAYLGLRPNSMTNSLLRTNDDRERAYLGQRPIVHTFTPGGK